MKWSGSDSPVTRLDVAGIPVARRGSEIGTFVFLQIWFLVRFSDPSSRFTSYLVSRQHVCRFSSSFFWTMDGLNEVGEVSVSRLQMDEQSDDTSPPEHERPALCDRLHGSVHDKENSPTMRAGETRTRANTVTVQEVNGLGELSPHWDGLRHDVINHCSHLIGCYQDTLAELDRLSVSSCFKSSGSKSDRHLQFVPTNLHTQRMEVTDPDSSGVWYEVITFGAPADHHQAFRHGGLRRLLNKHTGHSDGSVSYSQDESSRARELLASVAQLQPLVFGLAEELLSVSQEPHAARLQQVLDALTRQTEQFVHALKDELVKSALLAIHGQFAAPCGGSHVHSNGLLCDNSPAGREGPPSLGQRDDVRRDAEYDEEAWASRSVSDRAWANVAMSLNCIIAMADRLRGRADRPQGGTSGEQQEAAGDADARDAGETLEQLLPLVVTLRDCVREAVAKARAAMTFVVLRGAVAPTVDQGPAQVVQRRHAVFSQALSALVCGFMLKLYGGLEDPDFLQQLHSVGVLAQGSFVVEVPLTPETFALLPRELREGRPIRVHPVLFNIGINQQQSLAERFGDSSPQERVNHQSCERLRVYCRALGERRPDAAGVQSLSDLLTSLERSVDARKRKNVEVLWIAATVCRQVSGVRLTSCKSAKDRTAMSVTLEQCVLLRERHSLGQQHFSSALDCMRRDGCRMENVQKNVGSRKFAFSGVQLLTFPRLYRPPDGSYGSTH
ncbi:hypothetical protein F2P81_018073 [Scophthalmus maximus]|uniref:Uncharacterized protein n=1 Tax=Scophthalmus maximus TaxID=52904 RepID=A0A6A4S9N5_SCOMX|nr:hypothetical protein F2P81_018073 [Scophthalmus maximus]